MGLNIKKPSAETAIRQLAAPTGESWTDAVEIAVIARLKRIDSARPSQRLEEALARLRPIQEALPAQQIEPTDKRISRALVDELYDERGLPK
jgi:hypothetical protein